MAASGICLQRHIWRRRETVLSVGRQRMPVAWQSRKEYAIQYNMLWALCRQRQRYMVVRQASRAMQCEQETPPEKPYENGIVTMLVERQESIGMSRAYVCYAMVIRGWRQAA